MILSVKLVTLFGMIALLPAAVGASPPAHDGGRLTVPLCTGDGVARTVSVPVGQGDVPGAEQPGCCAKGCHSGARKRGKRAPVANEDGAD